MLLLKKGLFDQAARINLFYLNHIILIILAFLDLNLIIFRISINSNLHFPTFNLSSKIILMLVLRGFLRILKVPKLYPSLTVQNLLAVFGDSLYSLNAWSIINHVNFLMLNLIFHQNLFLVYWHYLNFENHRFSFLIPHLNLKFIKVNQNSFFFLILGFLINHYFKVIKELVIFYFSNRLFKNLTINLFELILNFITPIGKFKNYSFLLIHHTFSIILF